MRALMNSIQSIKLTTATLFLFSIITHFSFGQTLNNNWKADLSKEMDEFKLCEKLGGNGNPCAKFMGKSLQTVYNVNDFYSSDEGRYLYVNEISEYLKESDEWKMLGHAYEQNVLETAQANANSKMATVALYLHKSGVGHVVLITPGSLHPSGSWGFNVPNSTSFFSASPDRSYINKGLSYAFGKNLVKDVVLYSREY